MKMQAKQYFVSARELLPRIQQVYEERERWNQLAGLRGKMAGSSWSRAEISPEDRALSEYV